jgi:Pup amidohydrolase
MRRRTPRSTCATLSYRAVKSNARRLRGLETEYCLRFSAVPGGEHPGNHRIYHAILRSIGTRAELRADHGLRRTSVLSNGGALKYGPLPHAPRRGLLEAATPDCTSPRQLLVYQRAQQRMLLDALPDAQSQLREAGYHGELGLLKNCRDAGGNVYGAHESYHCELADGPRLWAYRAVLVALGPAVLAACALSLLFLISGRVALLAARVAGAIGRRMRGAHGNPNALDVDTEGLEISGLEDFARIHWLPILMIQARALKRFGFDRIQHGAVPFLISRSIMTGCGILHPDGIMTLSEKAPEVGEAVRLDPRQDRRAVLDTGNLLEALPSLAGLRFRDAAAAFGQRQTLQVGLGDSNVATVAEYLKVATTGLVIDMAEAGWLDSAPQPADPVAALRTWSDDISLSARAPMASGEPMSALSVQRYYLERAREWVDQRAAATLEEIETVRMWSDVLDALERNPDELVGKLDWVTKHWLINSAGEDLPHSARMKIALRYHELGSGYLAQLEDNDLAPDLLLDQDVLDAMAASPDNFPTAIRAEILRGIAHSAPPAIMSWAQVDEGSQHQEDDSPHGRPQHGKVAHLTHHASSLADSETHHAADPHVEGEAPYVDEQAVPSEPASNVIRFASFRSER